MFGINWGVRLRSKAFWLLMIPALIVLIQYVAALLGFTLSLDELQAKILDVVNAVFILLSILGVAVDVTTPGIKDSELTLNKDKPEAFTIEEASKHLLDK